MSRIESHKAGELDSRVDSSESRVQISLSGRITIDTSPALRNQLLAVLRNTALDQVTVDLGGVSSIDLSGIATLIEALKFARASKTRLLLSGLQERPRYLLEVSGLLPFFESANDDGQNASSKGQE